MATKNYFSIPKPRFQMKKLQTNLKTEDSDVKTESISLPMNKGFMSFAF